MNQYGILYRSAATTTPLGFCTYASDKNDALEQFRQQVSDSVGNVFVYRNNDCHLDPCAMGLDDMPAALSETGCVFGEDVAAQPDRFVVMQADRPLAGHKTIAPSFLTHGHWALIDKQGEFAQDMIEQNRKQKATIQLVARTSFLRTALYFAWGGRYFQRYVEAIEPQAFDPVSPKVLQLRCLLAARTYGEIRKAMSWADQCGFA